jgi:hypothetical protein
VVHHRKPAVKASHRHRSEKVSEFFYYQIPVGVTSEQPVETSEKKVTAATNLFK